MINSEGNGLTMALQRTATGGVRVSRWLLPADPPRSLRATRTPHYAVAELESLAVRRAHAV